MGTGPERSGDRAWGSQDRPVLDGPSLGVSGVGKGSGSWSLGGWVGG